MNLDRTKTSDGWKFEQVTSLKQEDNLTRNRNEFLLVLSRKASLPEATLNLHQGRKIEKVRLQTGINYTKLSI